MPDNNDFTLPESLEGLDPIALRTLDAQASAAFTAFYEAGVTTPEQVARLQELAADVQRVRDVIKASDAPAEPAPEEEPEAPAEPEPDEPEAPEAPAPAEPEGRSPAEQMLEVFLRSGQPAPAAAPAPPAPAENAGPVEVVSTPAAPAPVSIAADAGIPDDAQLPLTSPSWVILASADIPGTPAGSRLADKDALVAAIGAKARSLSDARMGHGTPKHTVASFQFPGRQERHLDTMSEREAIEAMQDLSSPAFLTASGGWCAPSETIYDFSCRLEEATGMLDLPTFTTSRGGVRYPISPSFADFKVLANNGLFTWTEAMDIAAATGSPTKPCFKIPCVTFDECRLELEGLCVTAGNLMDLAYPELIRRYMELVLVAHFHRMNGAKIAKILALPGIIPVSMAATFAAASAVLSAVELQVQDIRDKYAMGPNAIIEAVVPRWLAGVFRADVARRECCSLDAISDADVRSYLRSAGINPQFVSGWQDLGDEAAALEWPTEVDILLYPAGQIRELRGPRLDIAVARDSVLNETNDFTVAFTEESYQICQVGCEVRVLTVPICPSGASGERVEMTCA